MMGRDHRVEGGTGVAAERFIIHGDLGAATFLPWVARHMHKLGLTGFAAFLGKNVYDLGGGCVYSPPDCAAPALR